MGVIVVQAGKPTRRLEREVIEEENYLQRYIVEHPECLPVEELGEDIQLLVLAREVPTASGKIDAIAVDGDGNVYVIETKLYKNPDKRRVIAQVLDYGAALWEGGGEALARVLRDAVEVGSGVSLEQRAREFFDLEEQELSDLLTSVASKADHGAFRFVVLMDQLDDRLKTLINFVNTNSGFRLLGVGLDFYRHDEFEIIIPNLYGAETARQAESGRSTPTRARRHWSEPEFFKQATERAEPNVFDAVRGLYDWALGVADEVRFSGGEIGGFMVHFSRAHHRSVMKVRTIGLISLYFGSLGEFGAELRKRIEAAQLFPMKNRPSPRIPAAEWMPRSDELLRIIETTANEFATKQSA